MAIALFLPLTFRMDIVPSLTLLLALYIGGISGGLISAILIKIPGTPASIATVFDGGPMADRGDAWKALSVGIVFSFLGNHLWHPGAVPVGAHSGKILSVPGDVRILLRGHLLLDFGGGIVRGLSDQRLLACLIGLFMATVGAAPIDGFTRFTMGIHDLDAGFKEVPAWWVCSPSPNCSTAARKRAGT